MTAWPYPRWIAHRGAGTLAPENTLAAFDAGAAHGFRMFECDVKLSADGIPFLLHDSTLDRTTDGDGPAGLREWRDLEVLDAGSWHSHAHAGERLPRLSSVARWCQANDALLNIEIKPSPGRERRTGEVVAREAATLWEDNGTPPLLTSFSVEALEGAQASAPSLPRGLLLDHLQPGWMRAARQLGCVAVVCRHDLWTPAEVTDLHRAGMRCLAYTVNEAAQAQRLIGMGIDGIITDRVDLFDPD